MITREEGYGNDSHCTVLLNGESTVIENAFNNVARGKFGNDQFSLYGTNNLPTRSTTHKYGKHSWYFNDVETPRGIVLLSTGNNYDNWKFGKYDFCIDFSVMSVSTGNTISNIMTLIQDNNNYHTIQIIAQNSGKPSAAVYWTIVISGTYVLNFSRILEVNYTPDSWYHVACVRKTEKISEIEEYDHFTIFGNGGASEDIYGTSGVTNNYIADIPYFSANLGIGIGPGDNPKTLTNMYIDDFRISKHHYRFNGGGASKSKRFRTHNRGY